MCLLPPHQLPKEQEQEETTDGAGLQVALLLNLSRCCLRLAERTNNSMKKEYNRAAVKGCSFALAMADTVRDDGTAKANKSMDYTGRYLRARAYMNGNLFKHAAGDLKYLSKRYPSDVPAQRLSRELKRREMQTRKSEKKLAKEVCRWVDKVTTTSTNEEEEVQ
mmetsp:Transcript_17123/g.21351  ORF Transcript_17123/g.21351 Transcript_17123/m.21351 type:complete len:164 (+) Transcript_17123:388-879(+)